MKISFIIPVYNVEPYLCQCVDSIILQTYQNVEVILVDDGSPDNCPSICDEYAKKDDRIIALHKKNGGLSDARNYGMVYASGDYVAFLDSDDFWMGELSLEKLIITINEHPNVDFIGFNCSYYYPSEERFTKWQEFPIELSRPTNHNDALCILSKASLFPVSACMKLIKRDVLVKNNLFFKVGQLSEDIPWFIDLIEKSNNCIFINRYIYTYRQVGDGSSITHNIGVKNIDSIIQIIKDEIKMLPHRSFNKLAQESILSFLAYELILSYACLQYLNKNDAKSRYQQMRELDWLLSYTRNPKVKRVNTMRRILGMRVTAKILQLYLKQAR